MRVVRCGRASGALIRRRIGRDDIPGGFACRERLAFARCGVIESSDCECASPVAFGATGAASRSTYA